MVLCTADHDSVQFVRSVAVMSVLVMSTTAWITTGAGKTTGTGWWVVVMTVLVSAVAKSAIIRLVELDEW